MFCMNPTLVSALRQSVTREFGRDLEQDAVAAERILGQEIGVVRVEVDLMLLAEGGVGGVPMLAGAP